MNPFIFRSKFQNLRIPSKMNSFKMNPFKNEALQKWILSKMNPFKNESLQKWILSKMNPFKNESLQKWILSKMNPFKYESFQKWIPSKMNPLTYFFSSGGILTKWTKGLTYEVTHKWRDLLMKGFIVKASLPTA